jgi:TRAP-type uncharacterized transport system substrate-binding protein
LNVSAVQEARLDRVVTLNMMGDWGVANLHRICGWISAELWRRSPAGSRVATWTGRGGTDAIEAVLDGLVHTALFVPAGFAATVFEGRGISNRRDIGRLRALGTLPQDDRLVFAIDANYGVESFEDLRRQKPKFRLTTGVDDGVNMVGFAAHRFLDAAGVGRQVLGSWGATLIDGEGPWDTIPLVTEDKADAVLFEAVMTPYWIDLLAKRKMNFLPFEDNVLSTLEDRYAWHRATVPADRFPGLPGAFEALDFSDFLLICRDDLPDDIAHVIAASMIETPEILERQYRHLPPKKSPVTYPLEPRKIAKTSMPLHPGAKSYYAGRGLLG